MLPYNIKYIHFVLLRKNQNFLLHEKFKANKPLEEKYWKNLRDELGFKPIISQNNEEWKIIIGYENYECSNMGNIRNTKSRRLLNTNVVAKSLN